MYSVFLSIVGNDFYHNFNKIHASKGKIGSETKTVNYTKSYEDSRGLAVSKLFLPIKNPQ